MITKSLLSLLLFTSPLAAYSSTLSEQANLLKAPYDFNREQQNTYFQLITSYTCSNHDTPKKASKEHAYTITHITSDGAITLNNGLVCQIGLWYRAPLKNWKTNQRIRLSHFPAYTNPFRIENIDTNEVVWGSYLNGPTASQCDQIISLIQPKKPKKLGTITLTCGFTFQGPLGPCEEQDYVMVLHQENKNEYTIWNLTKNKKLYPFTPIQDEEISGENLEDKLNQHVFGQPTACKKLAMALTNYLAGFNNPKVPIGVFLFIGPTGVGKTEIAKALAYELYKDPDFLIRFDMSHFSAGPWAVTRFIGSPPGYVDSHKGGQFTNAMLAKPSSVVLLDEFEKAHPDIKKCFLPVFDEGFIRDAFDRPIPCNKAVFIMTSNACSAEICELFAKGYSEEKILETLEPKLMSIFSPELYNRVTTVVFKPLTADMMDGLAKKLLKELATRIKSESNIELIFDDTLIEYLSTMGYNPALGARPLRRLIDTEVVSAIAEKITRERISSGSKLLISFDIFTNSIVVQKIQNSKNQ